MRAEIASVLHLLREPVRYDGAQLLRHLVHERDHARLEVDLLPFGRWLPAGVVGLGSAGKDEETDVHVHGAARQRGEVRPEHGVERQAAAECQPACEWTRHLSSWYV